MGTAGGSTQQGAPISLCKTSLGRGTSRKREELKNITGATQPPTRGRHRPRSWTPTPAKAHSHCPVLHQPHCARAMSAFKALSLISKPLANSYFCPQAEQPPHHNEREVGSATPHHHPLAPKQGQPPRSLFITATPKPQSLAGPLLPTEAPHWVHQCPPPTTARSSSVCPGTWCTCTNRGSSTKAPEPPLAPTHMKSPLWWGSRPRSGGC